MKIPTSILLILLSLSFNGLVNAQKPAATILQKPAGFETYIAKGKIFSLLVPSDWKLLYYDMMNDENQYELKLIKPGKEDVDYFLVNVNYYADAYKTTERFFWDLMHPEYKSPDLKIGKIQHIVVAGRQASTLEITTIRTPLAGTEGNPTETLKKYVVFQLEKGFYVFLYEAPTKTTAINKGVFNKIVSSFKPLVTTTSKTIPAPEITNEEYKVFTDFFNTGKLSGFEVPQYFEYVFKGSAVFEKTQTMKKAEMDLLNNLTKTFGKGTLSNILNFRLNNRKAYSIKDKILVHNISIMSEMKQEKIHQSLGEMSAKSSRFQLDVNWLSRVGFNPTKTTALFYISHSGSPATSYWVLMEKKESTWTIKNVEMDKMIVF